MATKELSTALMKGLQGLVPECGFEPRIRGQSFYKLIPVGKASFHLNIARYVDDISVVGDIAVRLDALEDLVVTLVPEVPKDSFTVGGEFSNVSRTQRESLAVKTLSQVDEVARRLIEKLKAIGLPYIERFSDLEQVYKVLASPNPDDWIHRPMHFERGVRALAAASLLKQKDEIPALTERLCEVIRRMNNPRGAERLREIGQRLRA